MFPADAERLYKLSIEAGCHGPQSISDASRTGGEKAVQITRGATCIRQPAKSVSIEAGLDALTIKTYMGHASVSETYFAYGHLFPRQGERAAQAVAEAIHRTSRTAYGPTAEESTPQRA